MEFNGFGKLFIQLFDNIVPKTVENFKQLISQKYGYKGSLIHRIIPGFMIQGGDFTNGDGTGGHSIYGKYFKDENFKINHDDIGYISMANSGPDTNGSQFFITLGPQHHLDGKHVVFGKVYDGFDTLIELGKMGNDDGDTYKNIYISDCGIVNT